MNEEERSIFEIEISILKTDTTENKMAEANLFSNFTLMTDGITKFSGDDKSHTATKWAQDIDDNAEIFNWTEAQKLVVARRSLEGTAALWLQSEKTFKKYEELKTALLKEFPDAINVKEMHELMASRKKKKEESYYQYMLIMKELGKRAKFPDYVAIQYILDGIADYEPNKMILYGATTYPVLKEKLSLYEKMKMKSKREDREPNKSQHKVEKETKASTSSAGNKRRCYKCGEEDHLAISCTNGIKCYRCNTYGDHIGSQCPSNDKGGASGAAPSAKQFRDVRVSAPGEKARQQVYTSPSAKQSATEIRGQSAMFGASANDDADGNMADNTDFDVFDSDDGGRQNDVNIVTKQLDFKTKSKSKRAMKVITLCDVDIRALMDSGSAYNLIKKDTFDTLKVEMCADDSVFTGLGMTPVLPYGKFYGKLVVDEVCYNDVIFHVVPNNCMPYNLIVGREFLDYVTMLMRKGSVTIVPEDEEWLARVNCVSEVVVTDHIHSTSVQEDVKRLVAEYRPVQTKEAPIELKIILKDDILVAQRPRRLSLAEQKIVEDQVDEWMQKGIIQNAPTQEPVYRKVAIVENFFDIIYTVHVELEGRPGKHAGQKRTYRTITETYAFLPREAVTRFLTGCAECARRPRSASPPPLPTPSPSPTRHPTYLPFLPHCPTDYTRNWESEIDAAHSNYPYEPKFDYTELQPLKKVESPKATDSEDQEPTYIELTSKKLNGFDSNPLFSRSSPVEPPFREEEPVRTDPEIDKDENSLIDVEDVKIDSPIPSMVQKDEDCDKDRTKEIIRVKEEKTDDKKQKKYNPLDVANLTSKDPPKSASPPRKKLLPSSLEYSNSFGRFPKPWRPDGGVYFGGEEVDYSVPITTAYLKHMRSMAYQERVDVENKDNLTPEPADMNDDDNFSSQAFTKDAEKLKMMLLAWNYHSQTQGRNGDITESGADSMADLWASYHSALGLGSKPPKPPTPLATGHSSPIHVGSVTPVEPASTHDETSSSDRTKDDDDAGASDDDSDDRVDPQHHDPERLKAFNMFVRLFVDENLDRIVPISKQPKEKIQAIIDSCTRQFPEFAERARKRIRTYLKSCRRNKKVRGDGPAAGNGGNATGTTNAWDTAVRPTPAHLTSVQAEHILAQACENESLNAKRMRLGLDPVSQPMPTVPTPMAIDTTATSAVASSFLSLYSGAITPSSAPATSTSNTTSSSHSKAAADTTRPSVSPTLENPLLNNNSLKLDNANGNAGSKTASPASSPAPLFRPSFPSTFGTPQNFGRQSTNTNPATALSSSALLSSLSALPPSGVGVNAAMAAYQSALLSAMAAHTHSFPTNLSAPTDLSLKTAAPAAQAAPAGKLLAHKLSGAEVGAVRQLITGYRESAAFLLRSADELEALLLNQP